MEGDDMRSLRHPLSWIYLIFIYSAGYSISAKEIDGDKKVNSSYGRLLVEKLQKSGNEISVTTARKELKNVVDKDVYKKYFRRLKQPFLKKGSSKKPKYIQIDIQDRDIKIDGYKNVTYTFYGRGVYFWNFGVKTKIKMRARFYLLKNENGDLTRPVTMKNYSFLEIKVKNPSPNLQGSVAKYRTKIPDDLLYMLLSLDADNVEFGLKLKAVEDEVIAYNSNKNALKITNMFHVIKELSYKTREFIKPQLATSYERNAKKFREQNYVFKKTLLNKQALENVEYQITIDKNIKGYQPQLEGILKSKSFEWYFNTYKDDLYYKYPKDALAIEVKVPIVVDQLPKEKRSDIHNYFDKVFIQEIFSEKHTLKTFRLNKGKSGHMKKIYLTPKLESEKTAA